jgi:PAS domain S-box-containing protein
MCPTPDEPSGAHALAPEQRRLAALRASDLLDSESEEAFDRLTRLARHLLGVPVSLVSLVDADRQFFKSQQGLGEPWRSDRETPLSHSFCQHVVARRAPLIVGDARDHPLVRGNAAIEDLDVVAYLGIPIHDPDGHAFGSLCAIDSKPRAWTDEHLAILTDLARAAENEVKLRYELRARRRAEQELKDRESLLRLAISAAEFGAWSQDLRTNGVYWDAHSRTVFGVSPEEPATAELGFALIHPDDRARAVAAFEAAVASLDGLYHVEKRIVRPNGEVRWISTWGRVETDAAGNPTRLLGLVADITARHEMLDLLHERSRALEALNAELGTLNATLESRVKDRTASLRARSEQVHALTRALTLAEQRERRRLAHVLHDDLQQLLFGIQLQVRSAAVAEGAPALDHIAALLDRALTLTRTLSHELAPPFLDEDGLEVSLAWLAHQFGAVHDLTVHLDIDAHCPTPDRSLRALLVQLVRELLFNVVKHAGTDQARLRLRSRDDEVEIVVEDEGEGFDAEAVEADSGEGFGMRSVRERVVLTGGCLHVDSAPGRGTRVTLVAPKTPLAGPDLDE